MLLLGWVVTRAGADRAKAAVWLGATLYAGWITFTFLWALAGRPLV